MLHKDGPKCLVTIIHPSYAFLHYTFNRAKSYTPNFPHCSSHKNIYYTLFIYLLKIQPKNYKSGLCISYCNPHRSCISTYVHVHCVAPSFPPVDICSSHFVHLLPSCWFFQLSIGHVSQYIMFALCEPAGQLSENNM